ncbi:MAG: biotin transporter BioY [Gemmatimonadaceae bacterium]
MTTLPLRFTQDRRFALLGTLGFALALAAGAQVAIPVPGTPVPITLQPMIVVLAGMVLGPTLGAVSMIAYLAAGAAGLPVFSPFGAPGVARLLGPTGGYLIAFPAAAFTAGFLARRFPSLVGRWIGATLGIAVLFVGGITQLAILTGSLGVAIAQGITPFAAFDVVKALVAALLARPKALDRRG